MVFKEAHPVDFGESYPSSELFPSLRIDGKRLC
jgi:hypothetical protein